MNFSGKIAVIIFGILPIAFLSYAIGIKSEQIFVGFVVAVFLILFFLKSDDEKQNKHSSEDQSEINQESLPLSKSSENLNIFLVDFGTQDSESENGKKIIELQNRLDELGDTWKHTYAAMLELPSEDFEIYNLLSNGLDSLNIEIMDIQNELNAYRPKSAR